MRTSIVARNVIPVLVLLLVLLVIEPLGAASPKAVQQSGGAQRFVTIDFNDVDINLFIKYISELTQKNFIVDREVKGKVTIISPTRISEEDAYRVFESVLEVHGFAAVPSGSVIKIVPSVQARSKNIATVREGELSAGEDKVVTQIISLKYVNAEEVKNLLTPLMSKTSVLIAHAHSGLIILTDFYSNIARLLDIIRAVDVPSDSEEMLIIPLRHASAESVSKAVGQLFAAGPAQKGMRQEQVRIIPFERNNALIVFASKTSAQRIRNLVARLDEDVPRQEGNLRVIYLQHANAEELVKVLMNLPDDKSGSRSTETGGGKASSAPSAPAISKEVKVVADKETNALIITGPREEYEVVEGVIKKLDIPRRMVYLEALIMEVKVSKDFSIGVQWANADGSVVGGFSGNASSPYNMLKQMTTSPGSLPAGFTLGVLEEGIKIGDVVFPNLGAVVNAYKSDDDVNVIATPQILTTDNKKASIKVGENVPYITSKNTTDAEQDYTNYEYKDVATSLTITPQVNQAEVVRLEIGVEVIKLKNTEATDTPSTFTRTAETTVVVHNEQTVVIGGMIGQDTTSGEYKVPVLGDIPVLGWMFKSRSNSQEKTNLYIFITPHIVENPAEIADLYQKKRATMEAVHKQPGDIADQFFHPTSDPAQSVALSDIGFAKLQQNELLRAREYFTQALKVDANNGAALFNLAVVCEREGKMAEAESLYRKVLALPPPPGEQAQSAGEDPLKAAAKTALKRLQSGGKGI
ncbi:type II secretion system secretin GspD [Desulfobulbus propionicus]|nr:type II secretion system secretin GspD [Desulfobulbus propionicus]